jgi:two-component system NtrC family sensor kinase
MPAPPKKARPAELLTGLGEAILDSLPVGIYVVDRELRVVAWNSQREQGAIGQPRRRVLGKPLRGVLPEAGYRATEPVMRGVLESGEPHEQMSETPGSRLYQIWRLPVRRDGKVTHVLSRFDDVTERRALEMRVIASDRLAFLGQLVAGVAHEISNPLAGIAGCAEALHGLAGARPTARTRREATRFLSLIKGEVARCERLVRTLLESARPGGGDSCDVAGVAADVLRLLERHPAFVRVKVVSRIPEKLTAGIDADSLKQVVIALATNAARAMQGSGRLTLQGGRSHGRIVLDVIDTGPGVRPEVRQRIFEPYFTTDPTSGSGLGLAIARSLVRGKSGDLLLRPSARGAAFRVILRRARHKP